MSTSASTSKRVAIITGAAEGIGRGIALRLAKDGYDLGLFDLPNAQGKLDQLAEEIREVHGVRVVNVLGSVAEEGDVKRLVDTVVQELGSLYAVSTQPVKCFAVCARGLTVSLDDRECGYLGQPRIA